MAYWITTKTVPTASHYYDFEKAFEVTAGALMQMKICADTRYQLYINEHLASEGPCQGPIDLRY